MTVARNTQAAESLIRRFYYEETIIPGTHGRTDGVCHGTDNKSAGGIR